MQSPLAFINGVRHPEAFHGQGVSRNFFEGWYLKLVSKDLSQRWAIIPGIFKGLKGAPATEDQAFVQVLDGLSGKSWFHSFEPGAFTADTNRLNVTVGPNHFSPAGLTLDLPGLKGEITFTSPLDPWPVTWRQPGIMGWYGMVPFMECFHGIVSFGHSLGGSLEINGVTRDFTGGRGYIEKDWGKAFPDGYVWMHSNHISFDAEASLIASVALVPWLGTSFRGFIVGLKHQGKLLTWATWNGSVERKLSIDDSHVHWVLSGPDGVLELSAERVRGGLLHAPLRTAMFQRVEETMDATVFIRLLDPTGQTVLAEGTGVSACMEVFGDLERMLAVRTR
jgi:tocopherol cyclase